jgi:hypothetical protein
VTSEERTAWRRYGEPVARPIAFSFR